MEIKKIQRLLFTGLLSWFLSAGVYYFSAIESNLGLEALFKLRGTRSVPSEVVIVAMDDADSENALNVGDQYKAWRKYHVKLIHELKKQSVSLIVFDLHFMVADPEVDPAFAEAIIAAGNVLLADCVQRKELGYKAEFDGRKCSSAVLDRLAFISSPTEQNSELPNQLIAFRSLPPTKTLSNAALDHAPFILKNDAGDPIIKNSANVYANLAEMPSLPFLSWIHFLKLTQQAIAILPPDGTAISDWLSQLNRNCNSNSAINNSSSLSQLSAHILDYVCLSDELILDYYGPPRTIRMVSYLDVYNGKINDLQNKVIFVGKAKKNSTSNNDDLDYFQTPFSDTQSGNMSGVEIMATQFANLNANRFIRPIPFYALNLVLLLLSFVYLLIFKRYGWILGVFLNLAITGIYLALIVFCLNRFGLWFPFIVPCLQLFLISLGELFAWLPFSTTTKDVYGLCMITDIQGYTAIVEGMTPEEMDNLLNDFYSCLTEPVIANAGKINDVTGDATLSIWFNMPIEKQRQLACYAALDVLNSVEQFNKSSSICLPIRIGLFEGDMRLRSIDTGKRRFYQVIGNTPNIASRVESVNKILGTNILASKCIVTSIKDVCFRPVGRFYVSGRTTPVDLVELVSRHELTDEQKLKHQYFAEALAYFEMGRWHEASLGFQKLLDILGKDPPTNYYLNMASEFQKKPPLEWNGVVKLNKIE